MQYTAVHCNTLQYTALHCTTLHYIVLHCTTLHYFTLYVLQKRLPDEADNTEGKEKEEKGSEKSKEIQRRKR